VSRDVSRWRRWTCVGSVTAGTFRVAKATSHGEVYRETAGQLGRKEIVMYCVAVHLCYLCCWACSVAAPCHVTWRRCVPGVCGVDITARGRGGGIERKH
jgi:hypothetical protein